MKPTKRERDAKADELVGDTSVKRVRRTNTKSIGETSAEPMKCEATTDVVRGC